MTNTNAKILPFCKNEPKTNKSNLETNIEEMNSLLSNDLDSQTTEPICFSEEELMRGYEKMVKGDITFMEDYSMNTFYDNLKNNRYIEKK